MNILFLTDAGPNYAPDLLLHGLRKLFGPQVVDYPRKDCLYRGALGTSFENQFCPNWFPQDGNQIDREDVSLKISKGYFKYVFCDVRAIPFLQKIISHLPPGLVFVDGEDFPVKLAPGPYVICRRETDGTDFSIPLPMALPEEVLNLIRSCKRAPKHYSVGFLGSFGAFSAERRVIVDWITEHYPDSLLQITQLPTEKEPTPAGRVNRTDYYVMIQQCKTVLSLRGSGYDTFRFWENSACDAVHISQNMPLFIPDDFKNGYNILRFASPEELKKLIDIVLEDRLQTNQFIQKTREHLVNFHLTTKRAEYLLDRLKKIYG